MTDTVLEPPAMELARLKEALTYEAPFLIEKLVKEQIVDTAQDGEALFSEVVRYLILQRAYPDKGWEMISRRIDEVWHQFVLFTVEYVAFCTRYFGGYLHHFPSNAPMPAPDHHDRPPARASHSEFVAHYQELFAAPLPEIWSDDSVITLGQRVVRASTVQDLTLIDADADTVTLADRAGVIFTVTALARPALDLICRVKAFYVRELAGELTDEEKIAIVKILVARRVLLLAP